MLNNIKSLFFTKLIFTNLKDNKKLDLIRYNKRLQQQVDINLIDYQIYNGNYIVYETKTKGKEYDHSGALLYDGDFLNFKKHGKGKEYGSVKAMIFEGDFINGKRNGKGKEYHIDGKLIFEGEYLNGVRNGKGKEYHTNGKVMFEGEFLNGIRWNGTQYAEKSSDSFELKEGNGFMQEYDYGGKMILVTKEYLNFEGEFLNGIRNGKGKEYEFEGRLVFEGEYKNGKRWNGKGYDKNGNLTGELKDGKGNLKEWNYYSEIYEGEYLDGERSGKGTEFGNNSIVLYEGDYLKGKRNGHGKEYHYSRKLKFEGEYANDERNGKGKEYDYSKGRLIFEGEYLNGKRHGKGKEYNYKDEIIFEGEYLYDWRRRGKDFIKGKIEFEGEYLFNKKWTGKGYDENGNVVYELKNGNGNIREYDSDQGYLKYEGEYSKGKRNGHGKEFAASGKLKYEGLFLNGKRSK